MSSNYRKCGVSKLFTTKRDFFAANEREFALIRGKKIKTNGGETAKNGKAIFERKIDDRGALSHPININWLSILFGGSCRHRTYETPSSPPLSPHRQVFPIPTRKNKLQPCRRIIFTSE